jgi:hypothetical protein
LIFQNYREASSKGRYLKASALQILNNDREKNAFALPPFDSSTSSRRKNLNNFYTFSTGISFHYLE